MDVQTPIGESLLEGGKRDVFLFEVLLRIVQKHSSLKDMQFAVAEDSSEGKKG